MYYCLLLGMCYTSNLKSYLTTPEMVPSLDSLAEIVAGDLPWKMQIYGSAEEAFVSKMTDPVHQKFWREKIVVNGFNVPVHVFRSNTVKFRFSR